MNQMEKVVGNKISFRVITTTEHPNVKHQMVSSIFMVGTSHKLFILWIGESNI